MADRFFESNFDTKVLMDWISEISSDLSSLNLFTASTASAYNSSTSNAFLDNNKSKTDNYYKQSQVEQDVNNTDIKKIASDNEKIATEVIVQNVLNQTLLDKFLLADRVASQQKYDQLVNPTANETAYKTLNPEANNQTGFSRSYTPTGTTTGTVSVASPVFPKHNQTYNNHMEEITNDMISRESFTVFTGAANPNAPNLTFFKSWAKKKPDGSYEVDPSKTFTPDKPYSTYINDLIKNNDANIPIGSYKFFIEKLHGRYSTGVPYKKNKIQSTKSKNEIPTELTNRMVFAAYINNYNDNFNVEKSEYNFIGRGEGFPVYKQTKRTLTLEFSIMADYSHEMMVAISEVYRQTNNVTPNNIDDQLEQILKNFPDWGLGTMPLNQINGDTRTGSFIPGIYSDTTESLWTKMTFLSQCAYPYYRADGKLKEQPMIRIRIADFYDLTGMITSLSYDLNELEGIQIDLNPSSIGNVPMAVKVTMSIDIYHDFEPSSNYFGFYHRKEFDENTIDPVTGDGSLGVAKKKLDTTAENTTKNSPTQIYNTIKNEGLLDTPSILGEVTKSTSKDILSLRQSVNDIINAGVKISDAVLASRTKKAMQAYTRIQKIVNVIKIQQGISTSGTATNAQDGVNTFGNTVSTIKKGMNVNQTLKSQITSSSSLINANAQSLQNGYDNLVGSVQSSISKVTSSIQETNSSLINGALSTINDNLESIQNNVETQKYKNVAPKTIADILADINKKDGPVQNTNSSLA